MKKYIRSSEPDATYQNKRNPNKFIETKKYKDGHQVARQYMKWDTDAGEVKNYTGAKDAKRGRYSRVRKNTLDSMLEDYDKVETSTELDGWSDRWEKEYSGSETSYLSYYIDGEEAGYIAVTDVDGDKYAQGYIYFEGTGERASTGSFRGADATKRAKESVERFLAQPLVQPNSDASVETCINSATDLGYAGKYYKIAKPADYEGLVADTPEDEADYMDWVEDQLSRFNATFEGWAVARNKYYDAFANADNMELAIIGKHPDGSLSLYASTSDHLVELDEDKIRSILNYDGNNTYWL